MFSLQLIDQAQELLQLYRKKHLRIVTAESCTGGLLAALLTENPGASDVFERGFVTYSNQAKIEMLGVTKEMLESYGAVSKETAIAMAQGALLASSAEISIAITGIAGPGGATSGKPVGLVHIASVSPDNKILHQRSVFMGERDAIRLQAVEVAVRMLMV